MIFLGSYNPCNGIGPAQQNCGPISSFRAAYYKVLFIQDEYEFMDTDLVEMLQDKINEIINHT